MKTLLITMLMFVIMSATALFAQKANLVIFSEQGERFFAIINGVRQNAEPETNVKITDLNATEATMYKLKIIFEDASLGEMDRNIYLNSGNETTLSIRKNKKDEYVLRPVSEVSLATLPPPPPTQTVVMYSATPRVTETVVVEQTTISTTTTTGQPAQTDNVTINMNVSEFGAGISISAGTTATQTTTTSTTTVATSPGAAAVPPSQPVSHLPGYSGPIGCPVPMSEKDFANAKKSISSKSFEDSKLQIAKQIAGSNCLLSSQVRDVMQLFSFEDSRLEFAKYCYGYTHDIGNYYMVNDAFQFELSIDELNSYIRGR